MDKEQAINRIRQSSLSEHTDSLSSLLMPSARIDVRAEEVAAEETGRSRFGGLPSMPPDVGWPVWDAREHIAVKLEKYEKRLEAKPEASGLQKIVSRLRHDMSKGPLPLCFLAQLSLAEIRSTATLPGWPQQGTLLFFYEPSAWGFDPLERGHSRVFCFGEDKELAPVPFPNDLPDKARFPPRKLAFCCEWTLPTRIWIDEVEVSIKRNDDYKALHQELTSTLGQNVPVHRCGGHPQEIQGDMRLQCQLVTNGLYCGDARGYQDPRRASLAKGAVDWQLLLQVDSDAKRMNWMWDDVGRIYFWARRQDISAADFESAWGVLQCY